MTIDYLGSIRADVDALLAVLERGPLDARVPSCPDWDLAQLAAHVGRVHGWATEAVSTGARPAGPPTSPDDPEAVKAFFAENAGTLLATLSAVEPDKPSWNFSGSDQVAAWWLRRQAHEIAVHRWDAESAVGDPSPIPAELAVDGVDEFLSVLAPLRLGGKDGIDIGGSIHLHANDADGEWTLHTDDGIFRVTKGHSKGDVAVRGPASSLVLLLWNRVGPPDAGLEVFGDRAVLDNWRSITSI
jgi:uncharacterized protein (TIGR03083 family)